MQAHVQLRTVDVHPRYTLLLALLLTVAAGLSWSIVTARGATQQTARWPTDSTFFSVPGWAVSSPMLEKANGNSYVTRQYRALDGGTSATFTLTTSQNVKTVYRAGADVPFLGNGFEKVALPADAAAAAAGHNVSFLRRGADEGWLQVYAYGQGSGLTGNGVTGWGLAILDTVLGRNNDYYLLRVAVPTTEPTADLVGRASQLADELFPRVAAWYAGSGEAAAQPNLNNTPIRSPWSLNVPSIG